MKSFADWLDDNVASTREVLAKRAPVARTEEVTELPTLTQSSAATPVGWVSDQTPGGLARLVELRRRLAQNGVPNGPFAIGSLVRLSDPSKANAARAQAGAEAVVMGYYSGSSAIVCIVCVEWSDDARRWVSPKLPGDGRGQEHGFYYAAGFAAV